MRAGTHESVVDRAEAYLSLLNEYRERLHKIEGIPKAGYAGRSAFARELVEQTRSAVRTAIETTTTERNRVEGLLHAFTPDSGWGAVETLNLFVYKNACDWELIGTEIRAVSIGAHMTLPVAVAAAGRLRREAYCNESLAAAA